MVSIGDLKNNLRILQSEAHQMKYHQEFDVEGLLKGNPQSLLPLYNYLFTSWNTRFSEEVVNWLGDGLSMKNDVRFMECIYKILRDMFHFKPQMTKEQFFTLNNFAERKIMMCIEVVRLVRDRCRLMGPKNPTNPNIKVSSVVDTGRERHKTDKKSATELVTPEPIEEIVDEVKEQILNRKVADNKLKLSLGITEKASWQMKAGYLRPCSDGDEKEAGGKKNKERSPREEAAPGPDRELESPVSAPAPREEKPVKGISIGSARSASTPFVPAANKKHRGAETVHMPYGKQTAESGHMRVADVLGRSADHAHEWDPTEAVECILAKVRDLPSQLTSFMKAVEGRLYKIEDRLDKIEARSNAEPNEKRELEATLRHEFNTIQARLLLLENRVTMTESRTAKPTMMEHPRMMSPSDDRKGELQGNPFVSLERGDPLLADCVPGFSPIRQDYGDFHSANSESLCSLPAPDQHRLSSTPNQSDNATADHSSSIRTDDGGRRVQSDGRGRTSAEKRMASAEERLAAAEERMSLTSPAQGDLTLVYDNLDNSTKQQVARIKELFKTTQRLLPVNGTETVDG